MGIKGQDIQKILEENRKKAKPKQNVETDKSGGILAMANNPMVQMAIKKIPNKYKVLILLAFVFVVIGIGSTVFGLITMIRLYPLILFKIIGGIFGGSLFANTIYKVAKNKAKALRIIFTIIADSAILYWIIFFV